MKNLFIETELNNWKDIFLLNSKLTKQLLFRGQSNKDWTISSSLERLVERIHPNYVDRAIITVQEKQMIEEFQWKYPLFKNPTIEKENYVEWLSIMQHYGASTRLIDFTDSFFVATQMAISESYTDSAVWGINKHTLNKFIFETYTNENETNSASQKTLDSLSIKLANEKIKNAFNEVEKKLLIIRPENSNERIYRQQGLFVMPTNLKIPFVESLSTIIGNQTPLFWDFRHLILNSDSYKQDQFALVKINIPKKIHREILENLREMNINSEILFPGIEGLAKSLNYSKFV
ncbi:hypothetical protein GCM10011416_24190 [Polaribacter pacificus]|uniref:FRG domain-containing protein n=1 Tax=Polaribacter pacificus TaxID=1775173 RepID=A0A917I2W4_9FLAO|nr:FRG domain-containing protein [Polaribacter pacificus]GGH04284.1 hypothetical protein GCM10011416_24190 [Polaribacter pacificus]